jgi:CDP-diacylglycerol pyrophosphatase
MMLIVMLMMMMIIMMMMMMMMMMLLNNNDTLYKLRYEKKTCHTRQSGNRKGHNIVWLKSALAYIAMLQ